MSGSLLERPTARVAVGSAPKILRRPAVRRPVGVGVAAVLVALVPATAGTARGLVVPYARLSELLVVVVLVAALLVRRSHFRLNPPAAPAILGYCVLYTGFNLINAARRGELSGATLVEDAFGAWQYLVLFVAVANLATLDGFFRIFVRSALAFASIHAVVGLLQMADLQAALDLATRVTGNELIAARPDWKAPRSVGLFRSWHAYGGYLALTGVLGIAWYFRRRQAGERGLASLVARLGLIGMGLVASLTFVPIGMGAVGLLRLARRQRVGVYLVVGAVVGGATVLLTPLGSGFLRRFVAQTSGAEGGLLPQTIWFRIQVWLNSWLPIIKDNLLTGYGRPSDIAGAFAYAESMYILTLLVGGLPLLVALIVVLRSIWTTVALPPVDLELAPAQAALRSVFPFLLIAMFIHPYLADAGVSQMIYILAALSAAAVLGRRQ